MNYFGIDSLLAGHDRWMQHLWTEVPARPSLQRDLKSSADFADFVQVEPECFERSCRPGHFTASALVVNPRLDRVLLTHHKKLNLWLQLGGHADGNHDLLEVSRQEVEEESGLKQFNYLTMDSEGMRLSGPGGGVVPFDLDCHLIPAFGLDPEHKHYDVRFIAVADDQQPIELSSESHDLGWFDLDRARELSQEISMHRQFDKIEAIRMCWGRLESLRL